MMKMSRLFGVEVETDKMIDRFFKGMEQRSLEENMVKNPFIIYLKKFPAGLWVLSIRPLYTNFSVFGWLCAFAVWFMWGFTAWLFIPIFIGLLGFFWSKYFYYLMLLKGLRKAGYKGPVRLLNEHEIIERTIFGGRI